MIFRWKLILTSAIGLSHNPADRPVSQFRLKTALSAQTGVSGVTYLGRGLRSDGVAIILLGAGAVVVAWTLWRVTTFL
jgi:hypothetical protein